MIVNLEALPIPRLDGRIHLVRLFMGAAPFRVMKTELAMNDKACRPSVKG
jgi:hypothetical protein